MGDIRWWHWATRNGARLCVALVIVGVAHDARCQPGQSTQAALPATSEEWAARIMERHRSVISQTVRVDVADGTATRSSTIVVRVAPRGVAGGPCVRLDMGNLIVYADNTRAVAVHAENPDVFVEHRFASGLSALSLRAWLPPVPVPQVEWALEPESPRDSGMMWPLWGLGECERQGEGKFVPALSESAPSKLAPGVPAEQAAQGAQAGLWAITLQCDGVIREVVFDERGVLRRVRGVSGADVPGVSIECGDIEAGEPATWAIDTSAREMVASLTDLRAKPADVVAGDRVPSLALVTRAMEGFGIVEHFKSVQELAPQPSGPAFAALLLHTPGSSHERQLSAATRALEGLVREYSNQRMSGLPRAPRLWAKEVFVLELADVTPQRIRTLVGEKPAAKPNEGGTPSLAEPLFSTAGSGAFSRIAPGATAAIIVLDDEQRLRGVVRLDQRLIDDGVIRDEVWRLLSDAK
jgi:hypothetical protein